MCTGRPRPGEELSRLTCLRESLAANTVDVVRVEAPEPVLQRVFEPSRRQVGTPGVNQFDISYSTSSPTFGPIVTQGQGDFGSIEDANGATDPSANPTATSTDDCGMCVASQRNLQLSQDQRNLTGRSLADSWLGDWLGG